MCSQPKINADNQPFACRTCGDCVKARQNGWVARCMAEKSTSLNTFIIGMTYNDETPENRDGARAFNYKNVSDFLKRLRQAIYRHYGTRETISFLACGEKGSMKGRCHWHLVLFTRADIFPVSAMTYFDGEERGTAPDHLPVERRMNWKVWPHGHVTFQQPDEGGMFYAVKYVSNDQFGSEKSKGTMRETRSQTHTASYFRMSKRPPIGDTFLQEQIDRWDAQNAVPTSLRLKVPGYTGFWFPLKRQREYLLAGLHDINQRVRNDTGRDCPQWSTLLHSVSLDENSLNDWEYLTYGPQETLADFAKVEAEHKAKQDAHKSAQRWRDTAYVRRQCGGSLPCASCFNALSRPEKATLRAFHCAQQDRAKELFQATGDPRTPDELWRASKPQGHVNPWCGNTDHPTVIEAFRLDLRQNAYKGPNPYQSEKPKAPKRQMQAKAGQ